MDPLPYHGHTVLNMRLYRLEFVCLTLWIFHKRRLSQTSEPYLHRSSYCPTESPKATIMSTHQIDEDNLEPQMHGEAPDFHQRMICMPYSNAETEQINDSAFESPTFSSQHSLRRQSQVSGQLDLATFDDAVHEVAPVETSGVIDATPPVNTNNSITTERMAISENLAPSEATTNERQAHLSLAPPRISAQTTLESGVQGGPSMSTTPPRAWTPFYLKRSTLLYFILAYIALLVSLVVLGVVYRKRQGLATSESNKYYLWTYGPTASMPSPKHLLRTLFPQSDTFSRHYHFCPFRSL